MFDYPAHIICLSYDLRIIIPDVFFNLGIGVVYFLIPLALYRLLHSFESYLLPFRSLIAMFCIFIFACGMSHIARVLSTLYGGEFYLLDIFVCGVTFVASLITAFILFRNGKQILALIRNILVAEV